MPKQPVTENDLIDIATRMAQELCDIIGDAIEAGCENPFPATQALVDEWEAIYQRTNEHWKTMILSDATDCESSLILGKL